jgi:hypothetical protein
VPARSGRADPPSPHPATASIHAHAVRDGELCPRGGEGHQRWLLLIAPSYRSDMGRARGWSSARLEWLQAAVVGEEGQLPPSPPPCCHIPPYCHCGQQISFVKKISLQIYRGGGGGGGAHLCATVIGGWAPQRWPDLAFSLEARARRRRWSGRLGVGVAGAGRWGPVVGRVGG